MPSQLFATKFFDFIYLVLEVIMSKFKLLNNTIMVTADQLERRRKKEDREGWMVRIVLWLQIGRASCRERV